MNEKDKTIQEENKAVQDGIMSDDELDTVAGGILSPGFAGPENDVCCCLDGMGSSSRPQFVCACIDGEGGSSRRQYEPVFSVDTDSDQRE